MVTMLKFSLLLIFLNQASSAQLSDWTSLRRDTDLQFDLDTVPLQIRLNVTEGSDNVLSLLLKNEQGDSAGALSIDFKSSPLYSIGFCRPPQPFSHDLPASLEKLWLIEWSAGKLSVYCNGERMVKDFVPSDSTCTDPDYSASWKDYWQRDKKKISFSLDEEVTAFYRMEPGSCSEFDPKWSNPRSVKSTKTRTGLSLAVQCAEGYILRGSDTVTCVHETQISDFKESHLPECGGAIVDGGWTDYSDWAVCSKTCGGGETTRTRYCSNPRPSNGGSSCSGGSTQTQSCNEHHCPIHGGYTDYGEWSECSKECEGGTKSRSRSCTNPEPQHKGDDCEGEATEVMGCNEQLCPLHGGYTDYGEWSECSKECEGGTKSRSRSCTNPEPQHKGDDCTGEATEVMGCNEQLCPIHGGWTEYGDWGECSKECETGTQTRARTCTNPAPVNDGDECVGEGNEVRDCNTQLCSNGEAISMAAVKCNTNSMVVSFKEKQEYFSLHLLDADCSFGDDAYEIEAPFGYYGYSIEAPIGSCGTTAVWNETHIMYRNQVLGMLQEPENQDSAVKRFDLSVEFTCAYQRIGVTNLVNWETRGETALTDVAVGVGSGTIFLSLYKAADYSEKTDNSQYPVRVNLMDDVFMEVKVSLLVSDRNTLGLEIIDLRATYSADSSSADHSYDIVKDRCVIDSTFEYIETDSFSKIRFKIKAFHFINKEHSVYIHVYVSICDPSSQDMASCGICDKDATSKRSVDEHNIDRNKKKYHIFQGPIVALSNQTEGSGVQGVASSGFSCCFSVAVLIVSLLSITLQ